MSSSSGRWPRSVFVESLVFKEEPQVTDGTMPLEDFLSPGEQIKFQSNGNVNFGGKLYHVIMTDRRILLYARRGMVSKSDDIVTQKLDDLQGVTYSESGLIAKKGTIHVQGMRTTMNLFGPAVEIKTLYQQMMQFM